MKMFFKIDVPKNFALVFSHEYCKIFKNSVFISVTYKQTKRKQTCSLCFVNVFKFQENKFKIYQMNFQEIQVILPKKDFLKKPTVTMIIRLKKYSLVSRNAGDKNKICPGSHKKNFFNNFSRIFSNSSSNFKTTVKSKFIAQSPVFLLSKRISVKCKPKSFTNSCIKPHLHMSVHSK